MRSGRMIWGQGANVIQSGLPASGHLAPPIPTADS